jgi:hypothetical protein
MARIGTQNYYFNGVDGADFYLLYWKNPGEAWDYDGLYAPVNPVDNGDGRLRINLAVMGAVEGTFDIAVVAGEGDPGDLDSANLSDFGAINTGEVDFTPPPAPTNGAFA